MKKAFLLLAIIAVARVGALTVTLQLASIEVVYADEADTSLMASTTVAVIAGTKQMESFIAGRTADTRATVSSTVSGRTEMIPPARVSLSNRLKTIAVTRVTGSTTAARTAAIRVMGSVTVEQTVATRAMVNTTARVIECNAKAALPPNKSLERTRAG